MKPKILIADPQYDLIPLVPEPLWQKLANQFEVVRNPLKRTLTQEELLNLAADCWGTVAGLEPYEAAVFDRLPKLKVISRTGAGLDSIDLSAAASRGIVIKDCGHITAEPVAELALGLILSLLRKIPNLSEQMHQGVWDQQHGVLLAGKTVGIIGLGRIGKRLAALLQPFNCQIIGADTKPDSAWFNQNNIPLLSAEEVFKRADIISLHTFLAPENKHFINRSTISLMKKGVFLLNLSRGGVIDEEALISFLKKGHFAGVALDVFETEPYRGELTKFANVILTPHIGAGTNESRYQMEVGALENLLASLDI